MPNPLPDLTDLPRWASTAEAVYHERLGGRSRRSVIDAMEEWGEDGEDTFILAHLSYLQLQALLDLVELQQRQSKTLDQIAEQQKWLKRKINQLSRQLTEKIEDLVDAVEDAQVEPAMGERRLPEALDVQESNIESAESSSKLEEE